MERKENISILVQIGARLIALHGKEPFHNDWPKASESDPAAVDPVGNCNIGVVLGDASRGLVDVDLDNTLARRLADQFLPQTDMVFGRKSTPRSHRIYRCEAPGRTKRFTLRGVGAIVELRGNGGQTMFPPSIHPCGEQVAYASSGAPATVVWDDLYAAVTELALACAIAPHYTAGNRHDLALALSGVLRRSGWSQERAARFIGNLARAFHDNDVEDRFGCVRDSYGTTTPCGVERLAELTDPETARWVARQAGFREDRMATRATAIGAPDSELDCARMFVEHYDRQIIFEPNAEQYFLRRQGVYDPVSSVVIQGCVQALADKLAETHRPHDLKSFRAAAGVKNIMCLARPNMLVDARAFDADNLLLGVENGVLDLRTGALVEDPASLVTKRAQASFDPEAKCPTFRAFFKKVFGGDTELEGYVRRALGYMVTGGVGEQVIFIAIGRGANGKSTLFSALHNILGLYAGYTPMQTLMQSRYGNENTYDLAAMEGKRLVIAQEGEANAKLAEAKIKSMTGSDPIACRPIYGRHKTYDPRFKLVLVTNELPKIDGVDEAIWRRIKLLPFRVTIPAGERDPELRDKILAKRNGVLNFLIECYQEYKTACDTHSSGRGLSEPESVERELRDYRAESDTVGTFITECCELGGRSWKTSTKELFEAYERWCHESGLDPVAKGTFARNLSLKGLDPYRSATGNGWRGIVLKDDDPVDRRSGFGGARGDLDLD